MSLNALWVNYRKSIILILSIFIGLIVGSFINENILNIIKPFGSIFMNLLFTAVVPLVFFTISSSISNMKNMVRLRKIIIVMLIVFVITSLISCLWMLLGVSIFNPAKGIDFILEEGSSNSIDVGSSIIGMFSVDDFYSLLSKSHMFPLIIFSILFGICSHKEDNIKRLLDSGSRVMMNFISIIMKYAPIGLFAYFVSLSYEYGPSLLGSFASCFILYFIMASSYYFIFYPIYIKISNHKVGTTMKKMMIPLFTALGTCSSLATLPVNLETSEELDIEQDVREITLPIGSTIHMEGSSMSSILKILFLFTIFGREFFDIKVILVAVIISILSGVVMSGIPGGGMIGEVLIVSLYGLPLEAFPIISTIGWLIDSPGTALNAVGDIPSALLIDKYTKNKINI